MDIWAECHGRIYPQTISHELIRVVESQEQIATNNLVDSLAEQDVLEQLLEDTKPTIATNGSRLHYLLATPFRYPPLKHGSRFGTSLEPSLFYGSHTLPTALAETGYYRFLFWLGMSVPPPSGKFVTQHTIFSVCYETKQGLKLQHNPFSDYQEHITNPRMYSASQKLGSAMRQFGIEAFEFVSARDLDRGLNAALFVPAALTSNRPLYQQQWLCDTSANVVSFFSSKNSRIYQYARGSYLVDGSFPDPAT